VLQAATSEDWNAITQQLVSEARDALGRDAG
jgi:hypothetical protein